MGGMSLSGAKRCPLIYLRRLSESEMIVAREGARPADDEQITGSFRGIDRHDGDDQMGRAGTARFASFSASIASKVIQIGKSPLSHAQSAAVSPP
jgi:hypothetical protein